MNTHSKRIIQGTTSVGVAAADSRHTFKEGESLYLRLEENRSTGYSWQIKSELGEPALASEIPDLPDSTVGCPVPCVYSWKLTKKGTFHISFTYLRPWMPNDPVSSGKVTIIVN